MVCENFSTELTSQFPAKTLWKYAVADLHIVIAKIAPQIVASAEILEGDGGAGTIKIYRFPNGGYAKFKVDVYDEENFVYKYTLFEGLDKNVEYITYDIKLEDNGNGGTLVKLGSEVKTIGDFEITDEFRRSARDTNVNTYKLIGAYLAANPDAYA